MQNPFLANVGVLGTPEKLKTDKKPHTMKKPVGNPTGFNLKEVKLQIYDFFVMFIVRLLFYAKYAAPIIHRYRRTSCKVSQALPVCKRKWTSFPRQNRG